MSRYVTGTIAELAGKITFNNIPLGQPELSVMCRYFEKSGGFKQIGTIKKAKGRPCAVWEVDMNAIGQFGIADLFSGIVGSEIETVVEAKTA